MFKNVYRIRFKGLNLDRLINFIMQNYKVKNLIRISHDEMLIDLSYNSYTNLLSKVDTSCYNITIEKTFGYKYFLGFLKSNLAMFITIVISLSCIFYLNTRLLKINVYGANAETTSQIFKVLNSKNIKTFKSNKIKLNNLEQEILENVSDVSLVSAVIRGNVLIINVKEKLPDVVVDYADFVAPYNLIIDSIECYQGTLLKSNGDMVKKGEVIIGAYYLDENQNQNSIEPVFKLNATTYFCGQVEFKTSERKIVRTGKKIVNSCYNMFGKDFLSINRKNKFNLFEEECSLKSLFNNLFVPVNIKYHTFYELKETEITHNFEEEKGTYLKQSEDAAYKNLPKGLKVANKTTNIMDLDGGNKIIQTYLEVNVELTND